MKRVPLQSDPFTKTTTAEPARELSVASEALPAAAPELQKVTFWIRSDQHAALLEEKLRRLRRGEKTGPSELVRDAIDQMLAAAKQ